MIKPAKTTKSAILSRMMRRRSGASIVKLCEATGWQKHSVRAAISALRKAGYEIERSLSQKAGSCSVYKIKKIPLEVY